MPRQLTEAELATAEEFYDDWRASARSEREANRREFTTLDEFIEQHSNWDFSPIARAAETTFSVGMMA